MDTEKENVTKEVVKEIDTKNEKKKEKLFTVPGLIGVILFLGVAYGLSWYFGMQLAPGRQDKKEQEQKEVVNKDNEENKEDKNDKKEPVLEEIKLTIDPDKGGEFLKAFTYTLHNVYIDSTDHLIPDDKRNSQDLLSDDVTNFKIIYYLLEQYGEKEYKKYNTNVNGLHEVGAYAIKYNYFKEYYKDVMGKEFNDELIYKAGNPYRLNGEYLYGKVVSSLNPNYRLSNEKFYQQGDNYYFVVFVEELNENKEVLLSYRVKLCVSIVNDEFMLNSIVIY